MVYFNAVNKTRSKLYSLNVVYYVGGYRSIVWKKLIGAFHNAIDKAKELATKKDALFKISQKELKQTELYKREMSKTGLAFDSTKSKMLGISIEHNGDLYVTNWHC
ncbi:hypothetical protein J3U42_04640 [Gilliamella sp. B2923]|uniref:hypothetical protein n=1 Tax=Gilliamella sp. B2923 TaxID=2818005 RepID=UPI00226A8CE2|nr:hypothetical protein [Gilliamella sp. B2923]MCX8617675.1 hypothetical protein [Gilliamella sp. B2923]